MPYMRSPTYSHLQQEKVQVKVKVWVLVIVLIMRLKQQNAGGPGEGRRGDVTSNSVYLTEGLAQC